MRRKIEKQFKKIKKLSKYIRRVFKFNELVRHQNDSRKKRTYETSIIFVILFWASILRVQSFNKLEQMIKYGCFRPLFPRRTKMPSIDTIARVLSKWDLQRLEESFQRIIKILHTNKQFNNGTIDNYTVCALDGTDVIHTKRRKCNNCMYMSNSEGYYYGHKAIVAMVIGKEINYVIKQSFLNVKESETVIDKKTFEKKVVTKSQGEFTGAMSILPQLPQWVDIIVGDALYFNAPFIKEVLKNSKHAVIRLKDKTSNAYYDINHHSIYKNCNDSFVHNEHNKKSTVKFWRKDTKIVDSTILKHDPGKKTDITIYKFVEVTESLIKGEERFVFREIYVGCTDPNLSPKTVWKIIHYRWYIENTCFHQLKTYCNIEHCFRHDDTAIQAIFKIMCMAFNIFRSFLFKRLKKFKAEFQKKKATISWFIEEMFIELTNILLLLKLEIIDISFLDISIKT